MIQIRCKVCRKLAVEVSDDTQGTIKAKCKRCGRLFQVRLPMKSAQSEQNNGPPANNSPPAPAAASLAYSG